MLFCAYGPKKLFNVSIPVFACHVNGPLVFVLKAIYSTGKKWYRAVKKWYGIIPIIFIKKYPSCFEFTGACGRFFFGKIMGTFLFLTGL